MEEAKLKDTEGLVEMVLSRVVEKLHVVLIREPEILVGVEQQVERIRKQLICRDYDFTEELMDVAYDFEDVIDDLILIKSSANQKRGGNWKRGILLIRIHKKLELIKSKIPALPRALVCKTCSAKPPEYIEEMEWSPMFWIHGQNMANTIVSTVEEKVSALLAQKALDSHAKKAAKRVLDKFRSLNAFLKDSVELDDKGMAWMEELSHVSSSVVVVIEDFINTKEQLRKRSWWESFGKLKSHCKLATGMDQIYAKIQNLSIKRPEVHIEQDRSRQLLESALGNPAQPTTQEPDLASYYNDVQGITARLLADDTSFRLIPVMGMEGIGKTSLAKLIFSNKVVVNHFQFHAWPCTNRCSSIGDSSRILRDIMKQLMDYSAGEYDACGSRCLDLMMQKLKAFLIDNRSLIVMDVDPSRFFFSQRLLEEIADTSNGSRIIWITRKMSLPSNLQTWSDPHPLRLRGEEESWSLFTHALKLNIPPQLLNLKDEIVRTCGGLPLLIVKLAEELSHKDATIEEWSTALQHIRQDQLQLWSKILSWLQKDLSLYMKRRLFYLTLFPQDFDIPVRRLITLWVAEDLVRPEGENETPEDVAERCLYFLIAQGMVQVKKKKLNGNVKTVRLPDALRQYWLSKAQQATFLGVHDNTRSELSFGSPNMIHRLVDHLDSKDISFDHIHGDHKIASTSLTSHYQDVLSFLSFDTRKGSQPGEDIGKFLSRCISSSCFLFLRVLDFENVFRPKLPEAIGELTRLKYLGLRCTFIQMLPPSISKLQNVEILDLKHTNISTLPNSIWKLQRLRHLYLSESYRTKFMPRPSSGSLPTLQMLCGLFVDEKTPVKDGLDKLLNIRKLGLTMSSQVEAVADWVLKLQHLQSLRLKAIDQNNQPCDLELKPLLGHENVTFIYLLGRLRNPSIVSQFPNSLIDLTLSGSGLKEDPMQSLNKLPNLRSLKLFAKSYLGHRMICSSGGFPQLRVLKLWKLEQLEEWNVEEGALQALRDLEIRSCRRLNMFPRELLHRNLLKIEVMNAQ